MRQLHAMLSATLLCATLAGSGGALAQSMGLKRSVIEKADTSIPHREAVVARVELDVGASAARHTHPGEEIGYVLEGQGELRIDGAKPRLLKAGDAFVVKAGQVHSAQNTGTGPMRLAVVYVVQKDQPLASPAQ
ncbi:MAG: cupin domain-containing protein [Pseudomonadota bacterium]